MNIETTGLPNKFLETIMSHRDATTTKLSFFSLLNVIPSLSFSLIKHHSKEP